MANKPVELRVGGQTYRVVSSAGAGELERLADVVDRKLRSLVPAGRPVNPQALLLTAIALAHEVEAERHRADRIAGRSRAALARLIERVDGTLAVADALLDGPGSGGSSPRLPPTSTQ